MKIKLPVRLLFLAVFLVPPIYEVSAHHAMPVGFDLREKVFIRGTVSGFYLRNPHSFMRVNVIGDGGLPTPYKVELDTATHLKSVMGWSRNTFENNKVVEISGFPARNGFRVFGVVMSGVGLDVAVVTQMVGENAKEEFSQFHIENLEKFGVFRKEKKQEQSKEIEYDDTHTHSEKIPDPELHAEDIESTSELKNN